MDEVDPNASYLDEELREFPESFVLPLALPWLHQRAGRPSAPTTAALAEIYRTLSAALRGSLRRLGGESYPNCFNLVRFGVDSYAAALQGKRPYWSLHEICL
jgi:hypothetical protein